MAFLISNFALHPSVDLLGWLAIASCSMCTASRWIPSFPLASLVKECVKFKTVLSLLMVTNIRSEAFAERCWKMGKTYSIKVEYSIANIRQQGRSSQNFRCLVIILPEGA